MVTRTFLIGLLSLGFFVTPCAFAEYYMVYPAPSMDCAECFHHGGWRHHHARHKMAPTHVAHRHHSRNSYSITVYYPMLVLPCVSCCQHSPRHDFVEFNYTPGAMGHGRYVRSDYYDSYDPDQATGDDDASIHPDMDIDY